jgi:Fe-S cluster assembly protein SufD
MIDQLEIPLYESILAKFEIAVLNSNPHMSAIRERGINLFKTLGFPTIKHEEWRFTNVMPLLKEDYAFEATTQALTTEAFEKLAQLVSKHLSEVQYYLKEEHKGAYRVVTVNGKFNAALSVLPDTAVLKIHPFTEVVDHASFKQHFASIAPIEAEAFTALNTALFTDGLFIEAAKNAIVDKPIHIVNVILSGDSKTFIQPRHLIVLQANAAVEIIETTISDNSENAVFINGVTEIALEPNAQLHHYDIQTGRKGMRVVQRTEATQTKGSNYSNYTFTLPGTDFIRNNLSIHLNDEALESHLYGLYLTAGKQLVDNHTAVHHKKPHGESNQLYKGVLLDQSKAVFNGKIFVYEDAQKTNAFQQSNNILFSDKATVNAKPQLEIFADDVKCSHGTTIGQINNEALFYLQSRGLSLKTAKELMINAFAFDVTQKVKIPALRTYLEKLIADEMTRHHA